MLFRKEKYNRKYLCQNVNNIEKWMDHIILNFFYYIELFPSFLCPYTCVRVHISMYTYVPKAVCIMAKFPGYRFQVFKNILFYPFYITIHIEMNIRILTHDVSENLKFQSCSWNFMLWKLHLDFIFTGPEVLSVKCDRLVFYDEFCIFGFLVLANFTNFFREQICTIYTYCLPLIIPPFHYLVVFICQGTPVSKSLTQQAWFFKHKPERNRIT